MHKKIITLSFMLIGSVLQGLQTTPFISVFNDLIESGRDDQVSIQFQYGIDSYSIVSSTVATGLIQSFTSMAIISSGAASNGFAQIRSTDELEYKPGHEGDVWFTAAFLQGGAAGSTQWIGLFDDENGVAVGFNGTSFSILFRRGRIDTITPQANFNVDVLNGTGPSGFTLDPTKLNVFRIAYGWLGNAPIIFQVIDQNGNIITFHTIIRSNIFNEPSFLNPSIPMSAQVQKTSGTANVQIATASWNASSVRTPSTAGYRYFCVGVDSVFSPDVQIEYHILTIRNKTTFQGVPNKVQVRISAVFGGSQDFQGPSEGSLVWLRKNATVTGTNFISVDAQNSVVEYSTAGVFVANTGFPLIMLPSVSIGQGVNIGLFLGQANMIITLLPGESATITAMSLTGAGNPIAASLNWEERF